MKCFLSTVMALGLASFLLMDRPTYTYRMGLCQFRDGPDDLECVSRGQVTVSVHPDKQFCITHMPKGLTTSQVLSCCPIGFSIDGEPGDHPPISPTHRSNWITTEGFDAWTIYNQRATLFIDAPKYAHRAFIPWDVIGQHHGNNKRPALVALDYPLLLPSIVACAWFCLGDKPMWVPYLVSLLFTFCTIVMLVNKTTKLWAAASLIATVPFVLQGSLQQADVPLAFFILSSVVFAMRASNHSSRLTSGSLMTIAGFFAGCAAWTKNEGLAFALVTTCCLLWMAATRRLTWTKPVMFVSGMIPMMAFVIAQKVFLYGHSDVVNASTGANIHFAEMWYILRSFLVHGLAIAWMPSVVILVYLLLHPKLKASFRCSLPLCVTLGMLVVYFSVYLLSQRNLVEDVEISIDRLLLQVTPIAILATFLMVPHDVTAFRSPEQ